MALISFASLPTPDQMHDTGPRGVVRIGGLQLESHKKGLHPVGFKVRVLPATAQATSLGKLWRLFVDASASCDVGNLLKRRLYENYLYTRQPSNTFRKGLQFRLGTNSMASRSISSSSLRALARSTARPSSFPRPALQPFIHPTASRTPLPLPLPATRIPSTARLAHSIPRPVTDNPKKPNTPKQPTYELTFTCLPCGSRSAHHVSKQGYHHGSVLITCPSCRNRHVISDHLNIFGNRSLTVEDLMREKGRLVKRGTLGEDGDVEFWEDGSTTSREERQSDGNDPKPMPRSDDAAKAADAAGQADAPGSTFGKA